MSDIHRITFEVFLRGIDEGRPLEERRAAYERHLESCPDCHFDFALYDKLQAEAALMWPASIHPQRSTGQILDGIHSHLGRKRRRHLLFYPLRIIAWVAFAFLLLVAANWVFSTLRPEPAEAPTPTREFSLIASPQSPHQTPQVSDLDFPKIPLQPLSAGADISGWRTWSPDGAYFFFTMVEPSEDPRSDRVYSTLNFLNAETGQVCQHSQKILGGYGFTQLHWLADGRLLFVTESHGVQLFTPCEEQVLSLEERIPESIYPRQIFGGESDAFILLRGETHYWLLDRETLQARPLERPLPGADSFDRQVWSPSGEQLAFIQSAGSSAGEGNILTIVAVDSGQIIRGIQLPGDSEPGPPVTEWLLEDKLFVWDFSPAGPLLVDLAEEPPKIVPVRDELLGLEIAIPDETAGMGYFADEEAGNFHIAVRTNKPGVDALLIYHSETGEVERWAEDAHYYLLFPNGDFVFLNRLEDEPTYSDEFQLIWVDDPLRPPERLVVEGHTPRNYPDLWPRLLPGGEQLAFGSSQGISLVSIPDGQLLNFWQLESQGHPLPSISPSPDGRFIVVIASSLNEDLSQPGSALYLIRLEP